jgi:hypothetical protein
VSTPSTATSATLRLGRRLMGTLMVLCGIALCTLALPSHAETPKEKPADKKEPTSTTSSGPITVKDSDGVPKAILTEEAYRKLLDQAALSKKTAETGPSICNLRGKVDGNSVTFQAQYEFQTSTPWQVVNLGGAPASATGITLDGKLPQLLGGTRSKPGDTSTVTPYSVRVEKPGDHKLTLDLQLQLTPDPAGPRPGLARAEGFWLELARPPISHLDLELGAGARDVRLGGKPLAEVGGKMRDGNHVSVDVGGLDRLELSWQPREGNHGLTTVADTVVQVNFDRRAGTTTEAEIKLQVQSGQVQQWQLLVPPRADVHGSTPEDQARISRIDPPIEQKNGSLRTIHLKEPSAEPLSVTVTTAGNPPQANLRMTVGPYTVFGAIRHTATVFVSNRETDLVPTFNALRRPGEDTTALATGELVRRDLTETERRRKFLVAAFSSGSTQMEPGTPGPKNPPPGSAAARATLPWLDIELESVRGQMKSKVDYVLELRDATQTPPGEDAHGSWKLTAIITATPRQAEVDRLAISLPSGWKFDENDASYPLKVRSLYVDRNSNPPRVEFQFPRGSVVGDSPALKPFTVTVEASYPLPEPVPAAGGSQHVQLPLPRPLGTFDEGCELRVRVPTGMSVEGPDGAPLGVEVLRQQRRTPERLDLSWRAYRPEVRLSSHVDLVLSKTKGTVRHEMTFEGAAAGVSVTLHVPAAISARADRPLTVLEGGRLAPPRPGAATRLLTLAGDKPVVLEYEFVPHAEKDHDGRIPIPLVMPEGAGETKVRVWGQDGELPFLATTGRLPGWTEQNPEKAPGHDRWSNLVVRVDGFDQPLYLRLGASDPVFTVLVERALVQAAIEADGTWGYRVRYRLARLARPRVEVDLPAAVPVLRLEVKYGGQKVDFETLSEGGNTPGTGRSVRLRLPELNGPAADTSSVILELKYRLQPGQSGSGPLWTSLTPPQVRGAPPGVPTRWQVVAPANWVLLTPEAEQRVWGLRGLLWAPRLNTPATELETWLVGPGATGDPVPEASTLVCWREDGDPLVLTHVSQQAWLLLASLAVLVAGLLLGWLGWFAFAPRPGQKHRSRTQAVVAPLFGLLLLALLSFALLRPTLVGQVVYGAQPGVLVLLLVALVQWAVHERRRRQLVFLPSFSRTRPGSTLTPRSAPSDLPNLRPPSGMPSPPSEPSTVDAPQKLGSSVGRRGPLP